MKKLILIPIAGLALTVGACSNSNHSHTPSQHIVVTHVYPTPKSHVTIHKHVTVHVKVAPKHTKHTTTKRSTTRRSK